jgi:hypothetical protein
MRTSHSHREPIGKPAEREAVGQLASSLDELLTQAATLASENGVPPDAFAAAAWHAYLQASPALAEHIEQLQFAAGIEEMRNAGRLAKA